jgi:putative DNA methylase
MSYRKKLIEVALPLEAINVASAKEKSIRHGHPSTLHLWWARRPLAACRAVLFGSLVDDPSSWPERFPTEEEQELERQRLFRIIEELVKWENSNSDTVLDAARSEIARSIAWDRGDQAPADPKLVKEYLNAHAPPVLDPFCGGGSIPLEAQRLGLEAHGSDLNPVAVLITKALIEIPPRFAGRPPMNPDARKKLDHSAGWQGSRGLAEDVRYYGAWMRNEAERRIGHLYPKAKLPNGKEATVIAWLWARTVKCPNPACGALMPLVRSFALSTKKGNEHWVELVIDAELKTVHFTVKKGKGGAREGTVNRRGARCVVCSVNAPLDHVRLEGRAGRMGAQLMAMVVESERARAYLPANAEQERIAAGIEPPLGSEELLSTHPQYMAPPRYGLTRHRDLFTARQLLALTTFSNLVLEAREKALADAQAAGLADNGVALDDGGDGATAYADAVTTYLAFGLSKATNRNCALAIWETGMDRLAGALGRQALSMSWNFAETHPLAGAGGDIAGTINSVCEVLEKLKDGLQGKVEQRDATIRDEMRHVLISTDPPYYDNVPYADLSDFFFVLLRRNLNKLYPSLLSTLLVPKAQELVADQIRHGSKKAAQEFFEGGFSKAFAWMVRVQNPAFPLTVFYAFKQAENESTKEVGNRTAVASTGWETMLEGLIKSGFVINGTLPMRTEQTSGLREAGRNALASSIVLVCRPRPEDSSLATRREFLSTLKGELPDALKKLQHGNIAPVDLAQAAIGPGMAVFSRYSKVVESDGSPMPVRTALQLINQALDEVLAEQESEYDAETRWAVAWFDQFGMNEGAYGTAETLSKAKNTSVSGMDDAGVTISHAGKVRLLRRDELSEEWDPASDERLTVWEVAQHLIRALDTGGDAAAAVLFMKVGGLAEIARDLAYRLYTTSERRGWTQEALAYNSLVVAWPEIKRVAAMPAMKTSDNLFE